MQLAQSRRRPGAGLGRVVLVCLLALAGCKKVPPIPMPTLVSHPPHTKGDGLMAGFGRADITPPVGVPLAGNGFEGRQADGYRQRLYARAMVLQDEEGEQLAWVAVDLPHPSLLLHRLVAARVKQSTGLGADRLVLSVTHTHSGPGNHYAASQYNQQASGLPGYDDPLTRFLASGISKAVERAAGTMAPARAAWGSMEVPGVTWNRSIDAHRKNPGRELADPLTAIDDTLRMLRIDRCDPTWLECKPWGAVSIFAVHGTVMPAATTILDADVYGPAQRELEDHIVAANDDLAPAFRSPAFHLFANGPEGDVSPRYSEESRCRRHRDMDAGRLVGSARATEPVEEWNWREDELAVCLEHARDDLAELGDRLADATVTLHGQIGAAGLEHSMPIARAFTTIDLLREPDLCAPRSGVSTFGGADDARTRLFEWDLFGIFDLQMNDGGSAARKDPKGCQGRKKVALGVIQDLMVDDDGLPTHAQLAVLRIGPMLLAAVPGEVTTEASLAFRAEMLHRAPKGIEHTAILGLTNGYLQYITTEPEYGEQHYEGGSTLYGPKLADAVRRHIASLTDALAVGRDVAEVADLTANPGVPASYVPPRSQGPDPASLDRRLKPATCDGVSLDATWFDLAPGRFRIHEGQVIEIQRRRGGQWEPVVQDDDRALTVRWLRDRGRDGHEWAVEWRPRSPIEAGRYRVVLVARLGMPTLTNAAAEVDCP